ncbi:MarR family winged helix-turn-helix transcriptional regulator [Pedomonas mirosovicensis]|uniref:MarR family winged helix-turn-helix transcriptional regulator n=1 Tax=Pedomonas mirosovicensis TaxID=2908641 RepID=UPI0021676385|nr:MarR family winged helix-turn-helix transcriptional regulator [Pedomonas mirosovicensis]MCH8683789.1 MarR family winged helix-turn-helix transcriptional regulator [Pedomonas mirosovicensis]
MRPTYSLDDCSFLRLRKLARRITQIYDHALAPSGLSTNQFSILAHIWFLKNPTVSQLGEQMVMDPSTVTRNLRPLADKGWITLVVSEADRRQREARLTEAGLETLRAAVPHWKTAQSQLEELLGEGGTATLHGALDDVLSRLRTA